MPTLSRNTRIYDTTVIGNVGNRLGRFCEKIDKAFLIAQPMRKASWTKCGDAGGESVEG